MGKTGNKGIKAEKVEALFWRLCGQAFVAFPEECKAILAKHGVELLDAPGRNNARSLADAVAEIAQKYPRLATTRE